MKYTRNIGNKLKLKGFNLIGKIKTEEESYEVWENGVIEVTVEHPEMTGGEGKLIFRIDEPTDLKIGSEQDLDTLIKFTENV